MRRSRTLAALAVVVCILSVSGLTSAKTASKKAAAVPAASERSSEHYRLPKNVRPVSYDIDVSPDLQKATFKGQTQITLQLLAPSNQIVLNSEGLTIHGAALKQQHSSSLPTSVSQDKQSQRVTFRFPSTLKPGDYVLDIAFSGSLNDKLRGFYRSSYKDAQGKTAYMAVTQMEPTDARRMFPCFDEPSFKAKFRLTARIAPGLTAISNAPIEQESVDAKTGLKVVRFEPTAQMSSYLVALIVGDFKATPPVTVEGVPVRVWCAGRDVKLGNYARDMAARILPFQNSYFKIAYPWKKLDLIAIPDFDAGAMENPGAVTFRENLLLLDEKTASTRARQAMTSVIAHELAHMWFGDLVTMNWWDDLWLNEAFATWMSIKTVAAVVPEWDYMTTFGEERQAAMRTDATKATRAIHAAVTDPAQAQQMFDEITYEKGACVLRMLEMFTGEDKFREGIHDYLRKFSYSNASTADLWKALEAASNKPVEQVMSDWANKAGYPLITVSDQGGKLSVKQERFWLRQQERTDNTLWQVPLAIRYLAQQPPAQAPDAVALLSGTCQNMDLTEPDAPVTANAGGFGYYRVSYSSPLFEKLLPRMQTDLSPLERLALIGDQFALCIAGKVTLESYLSTVEASRSETDADVWDNILAQLRYLNIFVDDSSRPAFEKFVQATVQPTLSRLGWTATENETEKTKILRGKIIAASGTMGNDQAVIKQCRKLFADYLKAPASIDPDLIDAVTSVVAYNGNQADFDQMQKLFREAKTPEIEKRNLFALAAFTNPAQSKQALQMALDSSIRPQDASALLSGVLRSRQGKEAAWSFIEKNWTEVSRKLTDHMQAGLAGSADQFVEESACNKVLSFFKTRKIEAAESRIDRMAERLELNMQFKRDNAQKLNSWLAAHYQK